MTIIIKIIPFNQEDIVVAIGIIINPISLKKITLIKILTATDNTDILNGVLVSFLANKKLENIFINEKAGKPREKQNNAKAEFFTLSISNDPYPNNEEVISSDATIKANDAGKLRNKLNSKALFCISEIFNLFFD